MTEILSVIIVFGVIVLVHELGHFITAKLTGMRVDEFAIGFGPKVASIQKGETLYSVRAIPLGGFNKIAGMEMGMDDAGERAYWRKPIWARLLVISAGSLMNFLLPVFLFAGTIFFYGITSPSSEPIIGKVMEFSPAHNAGLMKDDRIISINGKPITDWSQIGADFQGKAGQSVKMVVERNGVEQELKVIPKIEENGQRAVVGILPTGQTTHFSLGESISKGFTMVFAIIGQMYDGLIGMLMGTTKAELSGPVGVAQMTSHYAKMGPQALINFMAILSINLGVINLLPIPALDGGHIIMLLIEAVRRKSLSPAFLRKIQIVGVTLLLSLMIFATTKDISRIFG